MKRILRPLQGLQWKLTLSYTLVTVVAVFILQAVNLAILMTKIPPMPAFPPVLAETLSKSASQAATFLQHTPPDQNALNVWLDNIIKSNVSPDIVFSPGVDKKNITFIPFGVLPFMTVLDVKGNVLATSDGSVVYRGVPSFPGQKLSPEINLLVSSVLKGQTDPLQLVTREPDGTMIMGAPIIDRGETLGVLTISLLSPSVPTRFLQLLFINLIRNLSFTIVFAAMVGVLFGFLTARGLTRRLHHLAEATVAWGKGNFAVKVGESSSMDEIGRLGRELNRMAEKWECLLQDRERLAVLEERTRLARDLHDSVNQALYGIALYAKAADRLLDAGTPEHAAEHVKEIGSTAQQALREMRSLIYELRPPELEKEGLGPVLQARLEAVEAREGIKTALEIRGTGRLSPDHEEGLYHIVREALHNSLKHGHPTLLHVALEYKVDSVCMAVIDDGAGFDPEQIGQGGLGLRGMKERAEQMGGQVTLTSRVGEGTTVKVEVAYGRNN